MSFSPANNKIWLKMIGAADWPLDNYWIAQVPDLLREVRTPRTPSGIAKGDVLVYYAAGAQRIFAIARSTMHGNESVIEPSKDQQRWPYVLKIQMLLAIPSLNLAPNWSVLGIPSTSVQQQSYIEISLETYRKAWAAITKRTHL